MERDLDRVRLRPVELGDLARSEIGAVAERDQLAVAVLEVRDRARERNLAERLVLEVAVIGRRRDCSRRELELKAGGLRCSARAIPISHAIGSPFDES